MKTCPACGAELETPLVCERCGALVPPRSDLTPFEVLGLELGYPLDRARLRQRLLELSRRVHPDYFGAAAAAQRDLAERCSAALNQAHETLADDLERADFLVRWLGGPAEGELRDMPREFLVEVLEWNEALEEARSAAPGSSERARPDALRPELEAARKAALERLSGLLEPLPPKGAPALATARRELNALRYLSRALDQIEALRLAQASSR